MRVLCSNDSSRAFLVLLQRQPHKLGWLLSPKCYKSPRENVPFALDNDAYSNWRNGIEFDAKAWGEFLQKIDRTNLLPLWAAIPDAVCDRTRTLIRWWKFFPIAEKHGWPLAFVVQDGMNHRDVPKQADIIFVGGSTTWKWRSIPMWTEHFERVHVGRCGTSRWKLERLEAMGVESCDGSGFFRATINGREARHLKAYLAHDKHRQMEFA